MLFNCDGIIFNVMGVHINSVPVVKYLGLYVDKNLFWKFHVDKVLVKCSQVIGVVKKILPAIPSFLYKTLYNSLLRSTFSYLLLYWFGNDRSGRWKLIKMVNCFLEKLANLSHMSLRDFVYKYNILDVASTYKLQCLMFAYSLVHDPYFEPNIQLIFNNSVHGYSTRISCNIHQTTVSSIDMHNFVYSSIKEWNTCKSEIKNLPYKMFILAAKKHLMEIQINGY